MIITARRIGITALFASVIALASSFGSAIIALLALYASSAHGATLLPNGKQTFIDANGAPLAGGYVYFYLPNSSVVKNTYQDPAATILNTNPVTLDASGTAVIYGTGAYRQVVTDANGNLIWDQLTADTSSGGSAWGGTSTGSANAQAVTAAGFSQVNGAVLYFRVGYANTGPATLNVNGLGATPLYVDSSTGPQLLTGGELGVGNTQGVIYDSTLGAYHLLSSSAINAATLTVSTAAGGTPLPLSTIALDPISAASFGVDPTGAADSTTAFVNFWRACQLTYSGGGGHRCFIPPGHYKVGGSGSMLWDTSLNPSGGWTIECGGNGTSSTAGAGAVLDFTNSPGTGLQIQSSVASTISGGGRFIGCGIAAYNSSGPALALGRFDAADTIREYEFSNISIKNNVPGANAVALQLNEVNRSVFSAITVQAGCTDSTGSCSGTGDALQVRQASYNTFLSGSFTQGANGVHFTAGNSFGNVFIAPLLVTNYNDITVDSTGASSNSFVGGQWQWCASPSGASCAAGTGYAIVHTQSAAGPLNISEPHLVDGSTQLLRGAGVNNVLITGNLSTVTTPAVPATGVTLANTTGRRVNVLIPGATTFTQVCIGVAAGTCFNTTIGGAAAPIIIVPLSPSDSIRLTYSAPVAWQWIEAE